MSRVNVLVFHELARIPSAHTTVALDDFEYCVALLASSGAASIRVRDTLTPPLDSGTAIAMTFDDGRASDYELAFPRLMEFSLKATFFVITERVGQTGYVSWSQLEEMHAAGMEIGSHSCSHAFLSGLPFTRLTAELQQSKDEIQSRLGVPIHSLAIPGGIYDGGVLHAALNAGYQAICTSDPGITTLPLGRRRMVRRNSVHRELSRPGLEERFRARWSSRMTWQASAYARSLVKHLLTPERYLRLRDAVMAHHSAPHPSRLEAKVDERSDVQWRGKE